MAQVVPVEVSDRVLIDPGAPRRDPGGTLGRSWLMAALPVLVVVALLVAWEAWRGLLHLPGCWVVRSATSLTV